MLYVYVFFFFLQIDKIYVERSESIELLCLLSVDEKGGKNKTRTELKKRGKKGRAQNEGTVHIALILPRRILCKSHQRFGYPFQSLFLFSQFQSLVTTVVYVMGDSTLSLDDTKRKHSMWRKNRAACGRSTHMKAPYSLCGQYLI